MNRKLTLNYITFETPLGWLVVAESPDGIALVDFLGPDRPTEDAVISTVLRTYPDATVSPGGDSGLLGKTKAYILAYLTNRAPLPKVPLDLRKGTRFDRNVWKAIEDHCFWRVPVLRPNRSQSQQRRCFEGRWQGMRQKPGTHSHTVPQGNWEWRETGRLFGRASY